MFDVLLLDSNICGLIGQHLGFAEGPIFITATVKRDLKLVKIQVQRKN